MANIGDIMKSGALGIGTAALARNPEMLKNFGLAGNLIADEAADREEKKRKAAMEGAPHQPGMRKGGKVKSKSASSRADGIAQRGKTRGKMV